MAIHRLAIIDWDDTVFPTAWTQDIAINLDKPTPETVNMFTHLDQLILNLVISLQELCQVKIVSNGSVKWINKCMKVLPQFSQIVHMGIVDIMSARDLCSDCTDSKRDWKIMTFKICVSQTLEDAHKHDFQHIISIGDSSDEHNALMELGDYDDNKPRKARVLKSVRLMRRPDLNEVVQQLQELEEMLGKVVNEKQNMTYVLNQSKN